MDHLKKNWKLIAVVFIVCLFIKPALSPLILGAFFSYLGFVSSSFFKKIHQTGISCTGKIIDFNPERDGDNGPLVEFTTITGIIIKAKPFVYSSTDLNKIITYINENNKNIPIIYDPEDPKKFVLQTEEGFNNAVFKIFIIVGLLLIGISICWLLGYIKMG